jgi:hypothetical protein
VSKLFDRLKSAARSRAESDSAVPNALLSHALHRAADERAALRAASPSGAAIPVIDMEIVEVARLAADIEAQERLTAAARERVDAEELAMQAAELRAKAEERATELAKEREETERSATREAQDRAQAEREATSALEERLRFETEIAKPRPQPVYRADPSRAHEREKRRLKRKLVLALAALIIVAGVIYARTAMPELFGEHASAPVFQLEHELKTPPPNSGK